MGDRTTPMKFGPEWLRNLSREPTSGAQPTTPTRPVTSTATASPNTTASAKVQLAKLRYGREEMLALYDRQAAEAPLQLKTIDHLYHSRGKPPYALNNNFEDDLRDSGNRNNPPISVMNPSDRYAAGRGRGFGLANRGSPIIEGRGRARGFIRQTSVGRAPGWHNGAQRSYPGAPDDDQNPPRGLWNNGNAAHPPGIRPSAEQAEWASKMAYRPPRQNHTNWRQQQNRDEGEEWRSSDGARRGQEKWEREWPERGPQEKWSTNRRQWGGDANDELPEWAVDNAEACGGTFDSSGAFHGYSNDDSNIPKTQDSSYQLARSHTHGSFAQDFKQFAKRRFDAIEVKFKKPNDEPVSEETGNTSATNKGTNANSGQTRETPKVDNVRIKLANKDEPHEESPDLQEEAAAMPPAVREESQIDYQKDRIYLLENAQASAQQRNDMLRRTEEREVSSDQGTYKTVMMATNNNHLRQQHQNIGTPPKNVQMPRFPQMLEARQKIDSDFKKEQQHQESKLVEKMLNMRMNEDLQTQLLNSTSQTAGTPNPVNSMANQMPSQGMQMRMNNQHIMKQSMGINQQTPNSQGQAAPESNIMQPIGITNSMLNATLGLPIGTGANMTMPMSSMPTQSLPNPGMLPSNLQGMGNSNMQNMQVGGLQNRMQGPAMQANSFQNAMPANNNMQQVLQQNMQTSGMNNNMQAATGIPSYQSVVGNSLFLQNSPNTMQSPGDMGNQGQQNMYPMHGHGLQQSPSQSSFNAASLYGNMMQPPPSVPGPLSDQWYYEDPNKTIQGPFSSKEMYGWYRAGFFTPDLMIRRACESVLMPLANYGSMPFGPIDLTPPHFNQATGIFDMRPQSMHENMINAQQAGLGPENSQFIPLRNLIKLAQLQLSEEAARKEISKPLIVSSNGGGLFVRWPIPTPPIVESLWSVRQPSANDMMWIQQPVQMPHPEDVKSLLNNLSIYFWDQPSGTKSMLPEGIKDMKTEDEILAQMRAAQVDPAAQNLTFMCDAVSPEEAFTAGTNIAPNLEELQKLIGSDVHGGSAATVAAPEPPAAPAANKAAVQRTADAGKEKTTAVAVPVPEVNTKQQLAKAAEVKPVKQPAKVEEKPKIKDATTKTKPKKSKEEKKEESPETKKKDDKKVLECVSAQGSQPSGLWFYERIIKRLQKRYEDSASFENVTVNQKRSDEHSPPKNKREDKASKKDLEKEKKEWLKDGFTLVKGAEKKDNKKKEKEEARAAEEAEKKRKEEEKRALEAEKNRTPEPVTRRQQLEQGLARQSQAAEQPPKKAPWSAQGAPASRDGLALSDIQRLEREKKLEQMKEQQQMMQVIAQQQAAAAQREQQEIQAGQLGWAKKKQANNSPPGQTLAEIQAEARKQASAVAAAAAVAAREETQPTPPPLNITAWGATNGGGFWDSPLSVSAPTAERAPEPPSAAPSAPKPVEPKPKKKVTVVVPPKKEPSPPKKENSPSADFETWCTHVLTNWKDAGNIDIPTFVAFLRDIESPYEVKDYVKCYLGDTKEASDFARQFLERRSRLLRVGMVTPSDDLCSPAAAITPRTNSGSDYTEVKSKGNKKTKKNKMLKVDARILGFSVTASEDRINIGDIDTV